MEPDCAMFTERKRGRNWAVFQHAGEEIHFHQNLNGLPHGFGRTISFSCVKM